jgi:hypothetical protein
MVDLLQSEKYFLAKLKERLARVQKGDVWDSDHPGPYTADEKLQEIARIKALIARVEAGDSQGT